MEQHLSNVENGRMELFVPITRVDEEKREFEGYAFVNEVVEGEGGIALERAAMEEATPDYLKWGALREMHQPKAAGTAVSVRWDENGAHFVGKVVDPLAWEKVKERVYKGLSVGVSPVHIVNNRVKRCRWPEVSLVDRPKDHGAIISLWRAEGVGPSEESPKAEERAQDSTTVPERENLEGPKGDTHYDCGQGGAGMCHGHTTRGGAQECGQRTAAQREEYIASMEGHLSALKAQRMDTIDSELERAEGKPEGEYGSHSDAGYADPGYQDDRKPRYPLKKDGKLDPGRVKAAWSYIHQPDNRSAYSADQLARIEAKIRAAAKEVGVEIAQRAEGAEETEMDLTPILDRLAGIEARLPAPKDEPLPEVTPEVSGDAPDLLKRLEGAESALAKVQASLEAAIERLAQVEKQPAAVEKPPFRYPTAVLREFAANGGAQAADVAALQAEKKTILDRASSSRSEKEQQDDYARICQIERALASARA